MPLNIFQNIINWFKTPVEQAAGGPDPRLAAAVTFLSRWLLPLLAIVIVVRIAVSLLRWKREPEVWGHIALPGGIMLPINHWENLIGRAKGADILINYPSVSRNHAVLVREDDGSWTITDLRSKTQGRGQYVMEPDGYKEVPKSISEKIISARTKKD